MPGGVGGGNREVSPYPDFWRGYNDSQAGIGRLSIGSQTSLCLYSDTVTGQEL